jgi:ribonuclease HI
MPWKPHKLRDSDIWAQVDATGKLLDDDDGRVQVVYKNAHGAKVYRASSRNLTPREGDMCEISVGDSSADLSESGAPVPGANAKPRTVASRGGKGHATAAAADAAAPDNAIKVWTDGGCSPNPGPGAIGVVVIDGTDRIEFGDYLGPSTNNICELTAIARGLQAVKDRTRPVVVYSDSQYAIGVVSLGNKAKANVELVAELRLLCKKFEQLHFVKVAAHVGIKENERVDALVNRARCARRSV